MYFYGHPHMAEQKQDDQLEHTYSIYVRIWDVSLKTCLRRWTIGKSSERGSGISVLAAWHDDDDDDDWRTGIHLYVQWDSIVFLLTVVEFNSWSLTNLFKSVCAFFPLRSRCEFVMLTAVVLVSMPWWIEGPKS